LLSSGTIAVTEPTAGGAIEFVAPEERTEVMKKLALLLALLALAAVGMTACGDDDDDEGETTEAATTATETGGEAGGGGSVSITANPEGELAYEEDSVSAPAGPVTIEFDNPASIGHDVVVEDDAGNELARTDVISGDMTTAEGEFEAGEYTFYCSVPGHREAGMEGTFTAE
jgi:plastocyanin